MSENGFELKIGDAEVRVRRCYGDEPSDEQIIELSIEQVRPHWFMASLCLTPDQASLISSFLNVESIVPLPTWSA